jgi:hypothetical protein
MGQRPCFTFTTLPTPKQRCILNLTAGAFSVRPVARRAPSVRHAGNNCSLSYVDNGDLHPKYVLDTDKVPTSNHVHKTNILWMQSRHRVRWSTNVSIRNQLPTQILQPTVCGLQAATASNQQRTEAQIASVAPHGRLFDTADMHGSGRPYSITHWLNIHS